MSNMLQCNNQNGIYSCKRHKCYVSDKLMGEALMNCVQENHCACVEYLIKAGADVNFANYDGNTAILLAIGNGRDKCEFSRSKGVDVKKHNGQCGTTLSDTCEKCVDVLIRAGADVNKQNENGSAPLMMAAKGGWNTLVEDFLKAGANVNASDENHYTALTHAAYEDHYKCVVTLVRAGADVSDVGNEALHRAIENRNVKCVAMLFAVGTKVNRTYCLAYCHCIKSFIFFRKGYS